MTTDTRSADPPEIAGAGADSLLIRANKLDILERLADALAHEIKNPLHSMVINLEVLKRRVAHLDTEGRGEVLRYVGVLGGELERVNRRIELLLRLSRPGRGPESTTLNELLDELMELVQLEARRREVGVEYDPGERPARVRVRREPTRQVVLNLVLEGLDRLEPGDVLRLALRREEGRSVLAIAGRRAGGGEGNDRAAPGGDLEVARALAGAVGGEVEEAAGGGELLFSLPLHAG